MNDSLYYLFCGLCVVAVLLGINLMSKVKSSVLGNGLSAAAMVLAIGLICITRGGVAGIFVIIALIVALAAGVVVGVYGAMKAKMIDMPQIIALLNGLGGAASALVAAVTAVNGAASLFEGFTAGLALAIGALTFTGSLIAAGKLARILDAKPKSLPNHSTIMAVLAVVCVVGIVLQTATSGAWAVLVALVSLTIGVVFVMRVGGADMPITISLLNALSGVAGGIAGMAINEPLLVAVGGIVGASGLILTQDMCKAMNRKLITILSGKTTVSAPAAVVAQQEAPEETAEEPTCLTEEVVGVTLQTAKKVIIVPGYGMALSQAQADVAALASALEKKGAEVKFAIHPVAGRMPGHMSVLLCEADIDYDKLFMLEDINEEFASCDIVVVIGANDVTNPAANTAEGTPIYGMPVLNVEEAPMAVFCNFDTKPGYAGVPNPLYEAENVLLMLGDAKASVQKLLSYAEGSVEAAPVQQAAEESDQLTLDGAGAALQNAKKVILVPGYGMALSQAQGDVARLATKLENRGAEVKFAIHPVAGRMPGHMSVLLCEADIDYDKLFMMEDINEEFASCDIVVVIGANDVTNPAANTAEGTPIYGMPVLSVEDAPKIVFCNFDTKPGYAGVPNPLYEADNVLLMLGDAKESVAQLQNFL